MAIIFYQTSQFEEIRSRIEGYIYNSVLEQHQNLEAALRSVEQFANALDRLFDTLEQMYQTPSPKDVQTEKSFPIHGGRYRVFFKVIPRTDHDFDITMLDIDDNKQSNLDRFPVHRIISFETEEE